jgi:hypothetical protein
MKIIFALIAFLMLISCSMKVEKNYRDKRGVTYLLKIENHRPAILQTYASIGHSLIIDKCKVFDDKNWDCDNSGLRMKNGVFYNYDEILQEINR